MVTFQDVTTRVFSLYREGDYQAALAAVQEARDSHPDEDNTLTFWEGCLLARCGREQEAIETLLAGIERGEWWPTGKLVDPDLDPVRDQPGWEAIWSHCNAKTQTLLDERPSPMMRNGTGGGTVIPIQGAHEIQEEVFTTWNEATPDRWTLIVPVASEPTGDGRWEWPHSVEASGESVISDLEAFDLARPVILTGFSAGSAIACHLINSTALAVDGLVAIAPWTTGAFEELLQATSVVRSMVICGDEDIRIDQYRHLQTELEGSELVDFELIEGLGHSNPPDLEERVSGFLAGF